MLSALNRYYLNNEEESPHKDTEEYCEVGRIREDGTNKHLHCECWYDEKECCRCGRK